MIGLDGGVHRWRFIVTFVILVLEFLAGIARASSDSEVTAEFVETYCLACHNSADEEGERDFEPILDALNSPHPDTLISLQEIVDQLNLGNMPPADADQPSAQEIKEGIRAITDHLKHLRQRHVSTQRQTVLRRMTRREYLRTIEDLFAIEMSMFDPTVNFPRDQTVQHLDNIGDALVMSEFLLQQYLAAADAVVEKALATTDTGKPAVESWKFDGRFFQQPELRGAHEEGFGHRFLCLYDNPLAERPEGAYGPLHELEHGVPVDGTYEVKVHAVALHRNSPYFQRALVIPNDEPFRLGIRPGDTRLEEQHTVQPMQPLLAAANVADDEPQWYTFRIPLDRGFSPRFTFENGLRDARNSYTRIYRFHKSTLPKKDQIEGGIYNRRKAILSRGQQPQIRIDEVRIRGPIQAEWPSASWMAAVGQSTFQPDQVPQYLRRFANRAYRRPVSEKELQRLIRIYQNRRDAGCSELQAYKDSLKGILCSPAFLYMQPVRLSDRDPSPHAVASQLSYFLTASMPDERLRRLADNGEILQREVRRSEAARLLKDPRSDGFVNGFLDAWLNLRALGEMPPDRAEFWQYYAQGLQEEMKQETRLFLRDLIRRDASLIEFLTADYSFMNRDLARLYGIVDQVDPGDASTFRRVTFEDRRRGGLLGQASVLTVTANGIETSPVTRGVWVLENVLGTPPPPPPDDVPAIDPDVRGAKSIRDLLEKHRSSATCNQCHRKIDPLGFALECFDPVGRLRHRYPSGARLSTAGQLPNGASFTDLGALKTLLLRRQEFFARTVTERMLAYALGRRIEPLDRPQVDAILEEVAERDYPMRTLIETIASSDLFLGGS